MPVVKGVFTLSHTDGRPWNHPHHAGFICMQNSRVMRFWKFPLRISKEGVGGQAIFIRVGVHDERHRECGALHCGREAKFVYMTPGLEMLEMENMCYRKLKKQAKTVNDRTATQKNHQSTLEYTSCHHVPLSISVLPLCFLSSPVFFPFERGM